VQVGAESVEEVGVWFPDLLKHLHVQAQLKDNISICKVNFETVYMYIKRKPIFASKK
jgi:hypothetical protein